MSSIDLLEQNADRREVSAGRFQSLKLMLVEYRRAVAAEEFYDHLRCASGASREKSVPRSQIARTVFERFYSPE
jgi:hypothetical protein